MMEFYYEYIIQGKHTHTHSTLLKLRIPYVQNRDYYARLTTAGTWPGSTWGPGAMPICCMSAFFKAR